MFLKSRLFVFAFICTDLLFNGGLASRDMGKEWLAEPTIRHGCQHSVRTLVVTADGSPIAVQNRTHALLNAELVSPVVKRMAACHTLYVNRVDEFTVQVICLAAALYKQEGITEDNAFQIEFQDGDMDDVRVLAMGIKRCVAYVRKLFVRQHTPKHHSDGN